jgi:hypothetical protein
MSKIAKPAAIKTVTTAPASVAIAVVPSFAGPAGAIVKAYTLAGKAEANLGRSLETIFRGFLDACRVAGIPRDKAGCDAIGRAMSEHLKKDGVIGRALIGGIHPQFKENTLKNYIGGAKKAHHHNVQWKASSFTDKALAVPWGKTVTDAEPAKAAKAGAVSTTNVKDLQATLLKAIEQARLLNMRDFANELGSFAGNYLDGFKFESKAE